MDRVWRHRFLGALRQPKTERKIVNKRERKMASCEKMESNATDELNGKEETASFRPTIGRGPDLNAR